MEIRPIPTEDDHRAALAEIESCWGSLVEAYEEKRWPFDRDKTFDPIDVLNHAIEELGHSRAELAELLGSRSRASEVLSRRRPLTVRMIRTISEAWKIPADLLVRPYRIDRAA